jgi:WD40 repeat protein
MNVAYKGKDNVISNTADIFLHFQGCCLVQSFADHSHRASIRSVCANGKFLASGSADETIHVYDMKARKESGILVYQNGKKNEIQKRLPCITSFAAGFILLLQTKV